MKMNNSHKDGAQSISSTCSYVPGEIVIAAGLIPKRIIPRKKPSAADTHIHPATCCYVKSLLADGLDRGRAKAAGIVFANSCDGMRKCLDIWKEYVKGVPSLFIDIPKKKDQDSIEFFASELRRFTQNLEDEFPGAKVTEQGLNQAIKTGNQVRELMTQVFQIQKDEKSDIQGTDVFNLYREGSCSDPTEFAGQLKQLLSWVKMKNSSDNKARILLTGNVINQPDLLELIEDSGGRVIALDTCLGVRHYDVPVEEDSKDPILALAKRYLTKPSCARMEGFGERFQYLKELAADSQAQGIIYSSVKYCDHFIYDVPLLSSSFKKLKMPFLFIENDYEWSGLEQIKTRVAAFLEMIGQRR